MIITDVSYSRHIDDDRDITVLVKGTARGDIIRDDIGHFIFESFVITYKHVDITGLFELLGPELYEEIYSETYDRLIDAYKLRTEEDGETG